MEAILVLILIGLAGLILIGSIMGLVAGVNMGRLGREIQALKRQVELLQQPRTDVPVKKDARPEETAPPSPSLATPTTDQKPDFGWHPSAPPSVTPAETLETVKMATPAPLKTTSPVPPNPERKRTFEETMGAQWSVWVGGIALFLGAVFLLRYTIEAGFFSPAIRVLMAVILGSVLLAAGDVLRRGESKLAQKFEASVPANAAYIPGILTAVGIFALLGSVYAAYALYGFIGPHMAFALMGILSLCGLALGLLHGPSLAALGLASSLITPLLIQTSEPDAYILYSYLTVVSLAAIALAIKRDWGWLIAVTLLGAIAWMFISLEATAATGTFTAWLTFGGLMYAISTVIAKDKDSGFEPVNPASVVYGPGWAAAWAGCAALALFKAGDINGFTSLHYAAGLGFTALLAITAWVKPRHSWNLIWAALLGFIVITRNADLAVGWIQPLVTASIFSALTLWIFYTRLQVSAPVLTGRARDFFWPLISVFMTALLFLTLGVVTSVPDNVTAVIFLALTASSGFLGYICHTNMPHRHVAHMFYVFGMGIAYMLAVFYGLDGMMESLGLMFGIIAGAVYAGRMPTFPARMVTSAFAALTALHILFVQIPDPASIGDAFIFNALWIYLALPALLCAAAAWWLSRERVDIWSEGLKALALTFSALFFVFHIRHAMNGGTLLANRFSFEELALQILVGLSFTLGGTLINTPKPDKTTPPHMRLIPALAIAVSAFTLAAFVLGLCLGKAPLLNGDIHVAGNPVFNGLILAYLLPAILLAGIAALCISKRPQAYVQMTAGLSLVSLMFYITSMIRRVFTGPKMSIFEIPPDNTELYAISAAWLILGILLLVVGLKGKSKDVRFASAIVITLTVFKAFLIDMASLEGVLRAMSFVVLGLVLIVIGRAYQRILISQKTETSEAKSSPLEIG